MRHAGVKTDLALKVLERNHSPVVQEQYDNEKLFASFSEVGKSPQLIRLLASWETDDHFYLVRYSVYFGDVRVYSLFNEKTADGLLPWWRPLSACQRLPHL